MGRSPAIGIGRRVAGLGLAVYGVTMLWMGAMTLARCIEGPCTQWNSELTVSGLIGGFVLLLLGGRVGLRRSERVANDTQATDFERPSFCLLRQLGWRMLALVVGLVGVISAMMAGPGFYVFSTEGDDPSAVFMAFGGPPIALVCFLTFAWAQRRAKRLKSARLNHRAKLHFASSR